MQLPTPSGDDVVVNTIGSVIAALIVGVAVYFWKSIVAIVNGWFMKVPVDGLWRTQIERGGEWVDHEEAELHQLFNKVWGIAISLKGDPKPTYRLTGTIFGGVLNMTYRKTGTQGADPGGITLAVSPEGNPMEGFEVGYDKELKAIAPRKYRWERRRKA